MRYSLSSRFRGTLLGAVCGGNRCGSFIKSQQLDGWGKMAVLGAESLIECGGFDLDDWRIRFNQETFSKNEIYQTSIKAVVATLPIALFFHENETKLRQNLQQVVEIWQDDRSRAALPYLLLRESALAVGYALAQSLTEQLKKATLIPRTIDFIGEPNSQLVKQLAQVQTLLEQGASLEKVVTHLQRNAQPSTSIALAFYCFLSTLEDLSLSVMRANRNEYQLQSTSAIVGALSGAYNSIAGIPATWQMQLSRYNAKPLAVWGMTTKTEMLKLSDSLIAAWSGVYDPTYPTNMTPMLAIAAPRIMRLR